MALVVTGVGFLIHVYSAGYMHDDPRFPRFFTYLNLFILMMLTLVLANNYLLLYVGWEGVGLASYLLIGFWFEKPSAADAGKKAFLVNRIGDFGLALAIMLIWTSLGTLQFTDVFAQAPTPCGAGGTAVPPPSPCCCCWPPPARAPRFRSSSGCPTPWKAPRRSRP